MDYKKKLNQIKQLLSIDVKLMEGKLDNGTEVMAESWEVGFPVFVMSDDGTQIPLPEGEYTLEDGTVFSVDGEGLIVSYGSPEKEPEEEMEVEQEEVQPTKKVVESTTKETHFEEDKPEEIKVNFSDEQKQELSEMIANGIADYFNEIKNAPVKDETELKKEELSEEVKPIKHSPEKEVKQKKVLYSQKRKQGTKDRVFQKLFN